MSPQNPEPGKLGTELVAGQRASGVLLLLGLFLVLLGERIVGEGAPRWVLDGSGLVVLLGALGLAHTTCRAAREDERPAYRRVAVGIVGVLVALGIYALRSEMVLAALNFQTDEAEQRYTVVVNVVWLVLLLGSSFVALAADRVLAANPLRVRASRVHDASLAGLSLALAIAMLFPLNYVAHDMNKRWDFGYFKTARPGTATQGIVAALEEPVKVWAFFPSSSDVVDELRTYFDALPKGNLEVEFVDQALEPELAKQLKVRDNGYIALVRGEGDDQQVQKVKIGKDFDSARRKLKKLDAEFQKALLKLARGQKVAYFTVGHGEMYWKAGTDPERKLGNLKRILEAFNYKVRELGLAQGLGDAVPEDASIVFVMAPRSAFQPEELAALNRWREQGGSLLVALEPESGEAGPFAAEPPDLSPLLDPLGIGYDPKGELANETKFVPRTYRIADRVNLFTNKYSTHPSVTTLSRNSRVLFSVVPGAGHLFEKKDAAAKDNKTTVTIRSLEDTWLDLDGDLEFDRDTEQKKVWPLAMAASGPAKRDEAAVAEDDEGDEDPAAEEPEDYRAVVLADATWASDLALPLDPNKGNFQMAVDAVAWLGREIEAAGTTESEEDVKIEHTKEGQGWLFYGTTFLIPFAFVGGGLARIRSRRKRGEA